MEDSNNNFVITINRTYGSGGSEIGHKLAKQLNIPCYDKKLLKSISKDWNYSEKYLKIFDERPMKTISYVLSLYNQNVIPFENIPTQVNDDLFVAQSNLIKNLAKKHSCVIIGRCANYILEDHPKLFSVFISSSVDNRIERATSYNPDIKNKHDIQKLVKKIDKQRREYNNEYSDKDWTSMENYHICLNSGILGIDNCIEIIKNYLKQQNFISQSHS